MTETTDPGGSDPAPVDPVLSDRLPPDGQSITARRAITAPATVDRAARTVEVVWSTGARARNFVPSLGGITEELDMSPNAVRMAQLGSGNHSASRREAVSQVAFLAWMVPRLVRPGVISASARMAMQRRKAHIATA